MLLGEFEHTIDDKNRLTLPAKFREALSGGLVLTRGMDGCLYCYPREDWERTVEGRLAGLDPLSKEGRLMQRFFFAGASEAEPDKQGRVMVPATLAADLRGKGKLIAVDRDPSARAYFDRFRRQTAVQGRFLRGEFSVVLEQLASNGVRADAVLFDLGVSSMQIDRPERGFSYAADAPLDMRMDPSS